MDWVCVFMCQCVCLYLFVLIPCHIQCKWFFLLYRHSNGVRDYCLCAQIPRSIEPYYTSNKLTVPWTNTYFLLHFFLLVLIYWVISISLNHHSPMYTHNSNCRIYFPLYLPNVLLPFVHYVRFGVAVSLYTQNNKK